MNSENFLNLCCRTDNLNEINQYYNKYEDNINIHYNDNQLFRMLCKQNKINILKYIYEKTKYLDWNFKILSNDDIYTNEDLFCFCARYAYLEIAKFIYLRDKENIDLLRKII